MKNKYMKLWWAYAIIKFCLFIAFLIAPLVAQQAAIQPSPAIKKGGKWNFLVYMAANNNLYRHGQLDIREMTKIGSTKHANIFVQVDHFGKKMVHRYKVEKNKTTHLATIAQSPAGISGTTESLYEFAKSIILKYPAAKNALMIWSHASGIKEPQIWAYRNYLPNFRDECFIFNEKTNMYEIDTNVVTLPIMRGIAFNEVARTYLTNTALKQTLDRISKDVLNGKKFDIIGFDACHQAMVEIGTHIRGCADYMLGSQELEPGSGLDYTAVLRPFLSQSPTPDTFARHIVTTYGSRYNHIFADLTFSAVKLDQYELLEQNIDTSAKILTTLLNQDNENTTLNLLTQIRRSKKHTKAFVDADYIDLTTFYKSLVTMLTKQMNKFKTPQNKELATALKQNVTEGIQLLQYHIIHNTTGPRAKAAHGLSIYFPTKTFHSSYTKNYFSKVVTSWGHMITTYLHKMHHKYADLYRNSHEGLMVFP
jgi:hypothetical protein